MPNLSEELALIAQKINTQKSGPEAVQLSLYGETAADEYLRNPRPLSEIVAEILRTSDRQFTDEQIKRVVEYANNYTFLKLFKASKDKVINFPVAKWDEVKRLLTPEEEKTASAYPEIADAYFKSHKVDPAPTYRPEPLEKTAGFSGEERISPERINEEYWRLRARFNGLLIEENEARTKVASAAETAMFYEGIPLSDIDRVLFLVGAAPLTEVTAEVAANLEKNGYNIKVASEPKKFVIDTSHPLVTNALEWRKVAAELAEVAGKLNKLRRLADGMG